MISEIRKNYENDKNKNIEIITQKLNQEKERLKQLEQSNFLNKLFNKKELNQKINEQREKIEQIKKELKSAEQLCCKNHYNDFNSSEIKNYISESDVTFDECDLEEYKYNINNKLSNREIKNLDDLIMVHKTNFLPQNGIIRTACDTKAMRKDNICLNNKQYNYEFRAGNNSIHFAINGPVSSHFYGNWDSTKFQF